MFGKRNAITRKHIEEHGTVADATVVEIADRGMTVSHNGGQLVADTEVILKTTLRIEPKGEPAFETRQKFRYPQMAIPSVGSKLTVRFDPEDHDKVVIDRDALPSAIAGKIGFGSMSDLLSTVQDAKRSGGSEAVADAVRSRMGLPDVATMQAQAFAAMAPADDSPEEERIRSLERLAALHASGALSDAEFAAQKAAVLGS